MAAPISLRTPVTYQQRQKQQQQQLTLKKQKKRTFQPSVCLQQFPEILCSQARSLQLLLQLMQLFRTSPHFLLQQQQQQPQPPLACCNY